MPSIKSMPRTPGLNDFGSGDLLIDTMQLVETDKPQSAPNHILETKIYSNVAQTVVVQAKPATLYFGGFELDKTCSQTLKIVNGSTEVINMHIIPPQTKYFSVKYKKSKRMVPGLTLDCVVEFAADEWRYYYDCIRVHCPGEENLLIPLHAYPVMSTEGFPEHFNFPQVPVGHQMTKVFPLSCQAPVDFEFQLTYIQPHPAFSVDPMSGIVPAHSQSEIAVTFTPTEFSTAHMQLQLVISQFNSKPLVCGFTGSAPPGLLKEITESTYVSELEKSEILDPRCVTPLDRARRKKTSTKTKKPLPPQEIEYEGIRFPSHLDTPYAVAQVLNQAPGRLRAKDLREAVMAKNDTSAAPSRQMKEAIFETAVRQNVYEERQNQLRWQVKLGDEHISQKARMLVLGARSDSWDDYKYIKRGEPVPDDEYHRTLTQHTFRRTYRQSTELGADDIKFDLYTNDMWAVRHEALRRFHQAGRKMIVRLRAEEKLKSLRKATLDWKKKKFAVEITADQENKLEEEENLSKDMYEIDMSAERIQRYQFPTYAPPNIKDDMAPDALGVVPYKPTEVVVKKRVTYFPLKVPQVYLLMNYLPHNIHDAGKGYVPPKLVRTLRTGADDEVISVPRAVTESIMVPESIEPVNEGDLTLADMADEVILTSEPDLALKPPPALFEPIEYPPLHIFNPAPGLQVFQSPVPYAEVDPDFHLCPLPRYFRKDHTTNQHYSTQRRYLDREDVIRGIMGWKKFPSQGLTSLANTPTLTNVWVPRWDDPFVNDLLPHDLLQLYDGLPEEDKENVVEDEDESASDSTDVNLTPEMVNTKFPLIDPKNAEEKISSDMFPHGNKMPSSNIPVSSCGPVPREKREEELDYFITKKYNRLGAKIHTKVNHLQSCITNPDLVLK